MIARLQTALVDAAALGGPVVIVLMAGSIIVLALVLYKIWQFSAAGVGRHRDIEAALSTFERGDRSAAAAHLKSARSYIAPVLDMALSGQRDQRRLQAEAEQRFALLERGFRLLDTVAQLAPLLGLFGTVLGMISAFQALQDAGAQVDPSVLAGGIWVALLTTAAGLVVAMPTAAVLSWLEARMEADRIVAYRAISVLLAPNPTHPHAAQTAQEGDHEALVPA